MSIYEGGHLIMKPLSARPSQTSSRLRSLQLKRISVLNFSRLHTSFGSALLTTTTHHILSAMAKLAFGQMKVFDAIKLISLS